MVLHNTSLKLIEICTLILISTFQPIILQLNRTYFFINEIVASVIFHILQVQIVNNDETGRPIHQEFTRNWSPLCEFTTIAELIDITHNPSLIFHYAILTFKSSGKRYWWKVTSWILNQAELIYSSEFCQAFYPGKPSVSVQYTQTF